MNPLRLSFLAAVLAYLAWSLPVPATAADLSPLSSEEEPGQDHDHGDAETDHDHDADTEAAVEDAGLIPWEHDLAKALEKAREAEKPLMIDFEAEWCVWCKKLDRETYGNEKVIRFVRANFIAVKVDTDENPEAKKKYDVSGLPTILFLSPTGEELLRLRGFHAAERFLEEAKKPANSAATLTQLKKEAEEKPDDVDAQRAYARALFAAGGAEEAIRTLKTARDKAPENAEILLDLANMLHSEKQLEEARDAYEAILALPDSAAGQKRAEVYLPLGRLLIELRHPPKAIEILDRYIEMAETKNRADAQRWEAHFLRGYAHALLKDAEKALADLEAVRDGAPDSTWGLRANYIIEVVRAD